MKILNCFQVERYASPPEKAGVFSTEIKQEKRLSMCVSTTDSTCSPHTLFIYQRLRHTYD